MELKIPLLDTAAIAAKEFLQKVITPPLEEVGLLIADQVKFWRFKNQLVILNKAEDFLRSKNLKTRKVSLKILTPLIESSSLEDEESLQDKWAALIANTVAENSMLDTTLYSHILSQLSKKDAQVFETIVSFSIHGSVHDKIILFIAGEKLFNIDYVRKEYNDIGLIFDNLIRLRLVAEHLTKDNFTLTELGFNFFDACRFK